MERSEKQEQGKKKVTEIKTFSVPFALGEINKNIIVTNNSHSKPSKEQLINQAFKFHSQGNISEAAKLYQYFINQGFNDHKVFSNYGIILKDLGKLEEAEILYRKAIKLNPSFAEAHSNLGNILRDLGKLEEAETSYRTGIELRPNLVEAHTNLGILLNEKGKAQEAFTSFLEVIKIAPESSKIYAFITQFLSDSKPSELNNKDLIFILEILIKRIDIRHQDLFHIFKFLYEKKFISYQNKATSLFYKEESFLHFINDEILIEALRKIKLRDIKMEKLLTKIRQYLCFLTINKKNELNYFQLQFITALAEQCFLNEYVYSLSQEESKSIQKIINKCINGELNEKNIAILACYLPLYKLLVRIPSLKTFTSFDKNFIQLIKLQILEPLEERILSKNIKRLGLINDDISKKVKSQYEENPYPRWRTGSYSKELKVSAIKVINTEISPNLINSNLRSNELKVLIAGCGTGSQIIQSQRYKNAVIKAIDLSSSSLSYAQRKINELGINNVELIQMDILEVGLLEEQFDIIECGGVLHHMANPLKGLNALLDIAKNYSYLKLALYSEIANKDIIKACQYINENKMYPSEENIKRFRELSSSGEISQIADAIKRGDFYSTSECRDLYFHYQAHRYNLDQLSKILSDNQLNFLGFLLPKPIKFLYKNYFPKDKIQTNLHNWARFEEKHPNTFAGMYQFWVSKTEN